jgi:glycine cleavage system H protein
MAERRYTKSHEWLTVDGKTITVGISDFAQAQLGDVVFLELPAKGRKHSASSSRSKPPATCIRRSPAASPR